MTVMSTSPDGNLRFFFLHITLKINFLTNWSMVLLEVAPSSGLSNIMFDEYYFRGKTCVATMQVTL